MRTDEADILRRVGARFFSAERGRSVSMPTVFAALLIRWSWQDLLHGRRTPRRYTRAEAERACFRFMRLHESARRRQTSGGRASSDTILQWSRADERAALRLRNRAFEDPETGVVVRFTLWDSLPPPPAGGTGFCVAPSFEWPVPPRRLRQCELATFLLGYLLVPIPIIASQNLERGLTEAVLEDAEIAVPEALRDRARTLKMGGLLERDPGLLELATAIRAHLVDREIALRRFPGYTDKTLAIWFDIGVEAAILALGRLAAEESVNKHDDLLEHLDRLLSLLRQVPMPTTDRMAFAEFIRIVRQEQLGLDATEELWNLVQHFGKQWTMGTFEADARQISKESAGEQQREVRATLRRAIVCELLVSVITAMVIVALHHWSRAIPLLLRAGIYALTFSIAGISCAFLVLVIYAFANTQDVTRSPHSRRFVIACGWGAFLLTNPYTIGGIAAFLAQSC